MTDKHEVTVYDRVPATARVSVEQAQQCLTRAGWKRTGGEATVRGFHMMFAAIWRNGGGLVVLSSRATSYVLEEAVNEISRWEARKPSAVLADIAAGPI
jgi:hypothetical protein